MNKFATRASSLFALAFLACSLVFGQATTSSTTFSTAVGSADQFVVVASATGISAPGPNNATATILYADKEEMRVTSVSGTYIGVERGADGTKQTSHSTSAVVWLGPPNYFRAAGSGDPAGSCTSTLLTNLPRISVDTGNIWTCPTSGPSSGQWTRSAVADIVTFTDAAFFVPPSACNAATTGTAGTGNNTIIVDGSVPALKASSTNAAGSHSVFTCMITVPTRLTTGKGATLTYIEYNYSVQTTTATSMVTPTLSYFLAPVAGTAETASSATLVAAGGTLTSLPVTASANLTAVSAGQYYTQRVTPATAVAMNIDHQVLVFTFELDQSASAAQIVTTPGLFVHFTDVPL